VSIYYYYPCYYYRPGVVFFDPYRPYNNYYYPTPFCTYGWFSFWLPASVVIIERPPAVIATYLVDNSGYDADSYSVPDSARNAVADIRDAWLDNRPELIQDHLQQYGKIGIYFQGRYAYSINGEDYYQMVQDAFSTLQTERFELGRISGRSRDEVFVSARHDFVDPDGQRRTVQLGYTLHRTSGTWNITAVDSSSRYLEIRDNQGRDGNYDLTGTAVAGRLDAGNR
jgi:catechol 2,3-dioxygenase-like lactoylglutathione lyase family enzyme